MQNRLSSEKFEVVWKPLPGSQTLAITSPCDHTLYEGARGPGKTLTQLMRFQMHVGRGYGQFWKGVIFDIEFDHLSGLVSESKKWFRRFGDGAKFLESPSQYKWVWPTGEELLFRHVKKIGDYEGFHGHEYPFIGWNELTKRPNLDLYDKFMSVNRSSFDPIKDTPRLASGEYATPDGKPLPNIPIQVFSTTNPHGPGHNAVKKRFIDVCESGKIFETHVKIFDPKTKEEIVVTRTQVSIFGSYKENPFLPAGYIAELNSIKDKNLKAAWVEGDWNVTSGGAFDDLFDFNVHMIPRFVVPSTWRVDRSFDWGSTHPYSVGWWAEANGEEAEIVVGTERFKFCPAPGSLIQIFELYGSDEIGTNKGNKDSPTTVAKKINQIEESLIANGWIARKPYAGPADNQIRNVIQSDVETIEDKMLAEGVAWESSDKSKGSRKNGVELFRDRLAAALSGEGPAVYFMNCCKATRETVPPLQRDVKDPDDVDSSTEDHPWDMIRYRILKSAFKAPAIKAISIPH